MNELGRRDRAQVAGLGFVIALMTVMLLVTAWLSVLRPVQRISAAGLAPNRGLQPGANGDSGESRSLSAVNNSGAVTTAWPDMRIDLNGGDVAELSVLPGIGPGLAKRIVAHRDEHGPFHSIDDLSEVSGIGPRIVAGLRGYAVAEIGDRAGLRH